MKPKTSIPQNPLTSRSWRSCLQLLVALAMLGWGATAHAAQTDTWTGLGTGNNWSTAANWDNAVTTLGDDLIFGPIANTKLGATNDLTALTINSIAISTNGYILGGNALTINNGISDSAGSNTCSIALTLGASQTFQNNAGGQTNLQTTQAGTIALSTNNLTIAGNGTFYLSGLISSTNGGTLTVSKTDPGFARLAATGNGFGTNTVLFTITSTNTTYSTNTTIITNVIVDGTPTVIVTNTVVTTNNVYTYVTNAIFSVLDAVTINSGTLKVANASGIPSGPSVGNVAVNGKLDLDGFSITINGLEGGGGGIVDSLTNAGNSTLTVGSGDSNAVFSGVIQNTAGTVALTKTGWGTETLNGPNSYAGPTIISQGTLAVGASGSLGSYSTVLTIDSGAVLDVTGLGTYGYVPSSALIVSAGTASKPYTNFLGSYGPNYPTFVVTTSTNYYTTTNIVTGVSTNYTTNFLSYTYSSNSIISVITNDIEGNFTVGGLGSISPVSTVAPGIATWTINGNLIVDNSSTPHPNRVAFLLNNTTTPGGGTNDLIAVNGTCSIGDELDVVVSPITGTLASGQYTLIQSANLALTSPNDGNPASLVLIAPRGITGTFDTSDAKNVKLTASGTATPASLVWSATSTASDNWDTHVTQDWKNGGTSDYFYSQDNVTFDDSGLGTINLPIPVTPSSMTFNNNRTNYVFNASTAGFISGAGSLTLNGSGMVTLNNPNNFTGNVTINGGTLMLGIYGGFGESILYNGVAPGQVIFGPGNSILDVNDTTANASVLQSLAGFTLLPGANAQIATPGNRGANNLAEMTIGPNINRNVGSSLYVAFTLKANTANNGLYFTNTIPWSNGLLGGGWAHTGSDWLAAATNFPGNSPASGLYNYTGYSNNVAIAAWLPTNNISESNASFSVSASATVNTLKLIGPATVTISAGQTLKIQTGGLLVSSASAGASLFTGGTLEGAPGADLIVLQNYTLNPLTINSVIADNGTPTALTLGGLGGTLILTGTNTYTGATYINGGTLQVGAGFAGGTIASSSSILDNGVLAFNRPDATSVGAISGAGSLTQLGTGTLTLTGDNTLKGLVTVSAGTLQLGTGGASGSVSNAVGLVDNGTLVINNSGTVSYPKVISGVGSLVQQGSGTLVIGTNETYSGNTILSNGAVVLTASGSISNTTAIVVNTGAVFDASAAGGLSLRSAAPPEILAGGGTIKGSVTTTVGTRIMPGTNGVVGTLTLDNDLNLNGGNCVLDVGNSTSDAIRVGGTLNQNSGIIVINVTGAPLANGLYPLIYATNGWSGSAANLIAVGFVQPGQLAALTNSTANELDLLVYTGVAPTLTWKGDNSQNLWDTTASSFWLTNGIAAQYQNGDYVIFDDSGSASPAVNLDTVVYPNTITVNSTNKNYTFGVTGGSGINKISGGATLIKNGPGSLTLQTVNDYIGGTVINGGVVQLNGDGGANDDGMIGSGGNITNNGTLVVNNANTETLSGNLNGNGPLVQQGTGKLILAGNNTAYTGPITSGSLLQVGDGFNGTLGTGNVTNNGSLLFNLVNPNSVVVNANISGSGGITNLGSGTVTLSGTDTYGGSTVIPAGTIQIGSAGAIPTSTAVIVDDSSNSIPGTLDLNGQSLVVGSLLGTNYGNGLASLAAGKVLNNGSGTATLIINGGTTNVFNGQIIDNNNSGSGKVALAVLNGSQLTLNVCVNNAAALPFPNIFSGGITISNAALALGAVVSSTPTAEGTDAAGGSPLGSQNILMTGTNAVFYAADSGGSTTPTINTAVGTLTVTAGTTAWINGPQRGQFGATTLTGSGNIIYQPNYVRDRLTFGNASGFTGTITIRQYLNNSTAGAGIGYDGASGLPNASVILGITNLSSILYFNGTVAGNVLPIGSLSGGDNTIALSGGTTPGGNGTAATIYAIGGLNASTTVGCQFVDGGCGIRKVGTGTLTLTNFVLSYGSQTVVSNGTLAFVPTGANAITVNWTNNYLVSSNYTLVSPGILDISAVGSGTLNLGHNAAQTLYGNGTLNGSLLVTNGSLVAPARRASSTNSFTGSGLTVSGSVTIKSGSTVLMTINRTNTPANDSLTAASIAYGGALIVTNLGDTAFANGSSNVFKLFNGTISGTFASITLPALPANELWVTNLSLDGSIALVNTNAAINPNPPSMMASFNGTQLSLGWPTNAGWILQSQTNPLSAGLTTPSNTWFDVAGSAAITNTVITVNPTNPTVFYRLRLP